ncbi:MAG: ABC transporter ATP-binding protein [Mycobacteriaceae bacterium]
MTSAALLSVQAVSLAFGGVRALSSVDMNVDSGTICGLVGPNGAGKTSLFNCICGYYTPTSGRIKLSGRDITNTPPHRLAGHGVARTFQHPVLQPAKTVLDNVLVGGHSTFNTGLLSSTFRLPGARREERALKDRGRELLGYLGIGDLAALNASELSYGGQKRVELARALMSRPSLLLLDELASGLTHEEVMELGEDVQRVRTDFDVGIVLVEHHMGMVSAITDKVVVLVQGTKVVEGPAAEVQGHPVVIEAYLGTAA